MILAFHITLIFRRVYMYIYNVYILVLSYPFKTKIYNKVYLKLWIPNKIYILRNFGKLSDIIFRYVSYHKDGNPFRSNIKNGK